MPADGAAVPLHIVPHVFPADRQLAYSELVPDSELMEEAFRDCGLEPRSVPLDADALRTLDGDPLRPFHADSLRAFGTNALLHLRPLGA